MGENAKGMTREEKENLISKVSDLTARDVLDTEDMLEILKICSAACTRRIAEIDAEIHPPVGKVQ